MGDVIVSLLPLIVGTAIVPVRIIIVLLLLGSTNGWPRPVRSWPVRRPSGWGKGW
jgi:hypothetical protein